MNDFEQHPDSEQLDRLRAGLLDDDAATRAKLERHLQACAQCRRSHDWPKALRGLDAGTEARLDALRRQALERRAGSRHWGRPLAVAAALALVAVALVSLLPSHEAPTTPQVATTDKNQVPDLYEDLDFYLWLADHKGSGDSST